MYRDYRAQRVSRMLGSPVGVPRAVGGGRSQAERTLGAERHDAVLSTIGAALGCRSLWQHWGCRNCSEAQGLHHPRDPKSGSLKDSIVPRGNQEKLGADLCHSCSRYKQKPPGLSTQRFFPTTEKKKFLFYKESWKKGICSAGCGSLWHKRLSPREWKWMKHRQSDNEWSLGKKL